MRNLLQETIDIITANGRDVEDVLWVGSEDGQYATDWDGFKAIADIEYDAGFGGQEVAYDLVVVAWHWWLERHEYDGSEWWEFKSTKTKQQDTKPLVRVKDGTVWASVEHMNGPANKYGEERSERPA